MDANEDDLKKAFRRKSLQYHPDKVQASGAASDACEVNARFNEIQEAGDFLSNADRKQMYDTFGVDIGDKSPETEVCGCASGSPASHGSCAWSSSQA